MLSKSTFKTKRPSMGRGFPICMLNLHKCRMPISEIHGKQDHTPGRVVTPVPNSCMQGTGGASSNLPPAQYKSRAHTSPEALRPNAATWFSDGISGFQGFQGGYHLAQRPSPILIISTESHSFSIWILRRPSRKSIKRK